jgi:hypothetical protein
MTGESVKPAVSLVLILASHHEACDDPAVDRDLQRRIGANEAVFREVNEGIARGQWPGERTSAIGFRCECARLGCNKVIDMTLPEYEGVRASARRFVVVPGHEIPGAERVVVRRPDYVVVEKRDEAGEEAESSDPRD